MAEQRCPRCGSDTCPGIDDVLTCTCLVDGLSAPDEARKALLATANPPLTMLDMLDALAGSADQFVGFARNGHPVDHRGVEFYQRVGRLLRDAHSRLATKRPPARHVEQDMRPLPDGEDVSSHAMGPMFEHADGRLCAYHHRLGLWVGPDFKHECTRDHAGLPTDRGPRLEGQTGVPVYMTEPDGPRWKFTVYGNDVEVCVERGTLWARVRRRGGERYTTWMRGGESVG